MTSEPDGVYHSNHNFIHPTAIIDPNVRMGKDNVIGPYCSIEKNVIMGDNNYFGPHCIIGEWPESDCEKASLVVRIGSDNKFFKQVTIDGATTGETVIMDRCEFLKNSHVGHDAFIFSDVSLRCNAVVGGHCTINHHVVLGVNSFVHQRMEIPKNVIIGANSMVSKKQIIQAGCIYGGVPVRLLKKRL